MLRIYLSGSVRKGDRDPRPNREFWSEDDENKIIRGVTDAHVVLLNPNKTAIRRKDIRSNFGCDLYLVSTSHVILVDARSKKGVGIGAEMMFATLRSIPVISWVPQNSHYRKDRLPNVFGEDLVDWIHPFIHGLSDYIVDDLDQVIALLNRYVEDGCLPIKKDPEAAIAYFKAQPDAVTLLVD
jgi:hypothetical protein